MPLWKPKKYTISKPKKQPQQTNKKPSGKKLVCIDCLHPHNVVPPNSTCIKCSGRVRRLDSGLEFDRLTDLFHDPNITNIDVQYVLEKNLPEAIYDYGLNRMPIITGYKNKKNVQKGYKADFIYYDSTTLAGWVVEELKPHPDKMDFRNKMSLEKSKANLVDAFNQHKGFGHICLTYPESNIENNRLVSYKRLFVDRAGEAVRYRSYDEMFS